MRPVPTAEPAPKHTSVNLYEKLTAIPARSVHLLGTDEEWPGTEDSRVDDRLDVHDREPVTVPFAGWWSSSAMPDFGRYRRRKRNRERLIDTTLELCAALGYEATTVDQIAAVADIGPDRFVDYFENKDAVLMAVLDDAQQAVAAAFVHVGGGINPEQALLTAIIEDLAVIGEGCGVATAQRLAAIAQTVRAHADLEKHASAAELADDFFEVTVERPTLDLTRIASWN